MRYTITFDDGLTIETDDIHAALSRHMEKGRTPEHVDTNEPERTITDERRLVNDHLGPLGTKRHWLTVPQKRELYDMADGFNSTPDMWDWSHVRDASDSAINRMETRLQEMIA